MISELQSVCDSDIAMIAVREDILRVKNAIDLAKKDLQQKEQVRLETKSEIDEIRDKNAELDAEIKVFNQKFNS